MSRRSRSGFALVAALISVVLVAALIVGTFLATTEDARVSTATTLGAHALTAAETAVQSEGAWATSRCDSIGIGQRSAKMAVYDGIPVALTLVRLDSADFLLVGEASAGGDLPGGGGVVRRRIGLLLRRAADSAGRTSLSGFGERAWSELF